MALCLALVFSVSSAKAEQCEARGATFDWDTIMPERCDRDGDCYVRNNNRCIGLNDLADMCMYLQNKKCHNVNLVTPTHFVPQFLKALKIAVKRGFHLPIVYNSSGYDSIETLQLLDGIIDIYLPDMKYGNDQNALEYSNAQEYTKYNRIAIKEMFRQVGLLKTDRDGIAEKGLLIRHLVLPYQIADSKKIYPIRYP